MQKGIKLLVFLLTFHSFIGLATLSATSNKTIVGEKPSFTEEVVEKMTDSDLFGLTINGTNYYGNDAVKAAPINLYQPIKDVIKVAPMRIPETNEYYDPDDDPFGEILPSKLTTQWYYTNAKGESKTFNPTSESFCNLVAVKKFYPPYKYVISANLTLSSQYGNPRTNDYTTPKPSKTYTFFKDSSEAKLCFAKPELSPTNNTGDAIKDVWDPKYGFLIHSDTDNSVNFPQTAFYGARFQLLLSADVVNDYQWKVVKGDELVNISTNNPNIVNVNFTSNEAKDPMKAWGLVVPNGYEVVIEGTHKTEGTKLRYPFKIKRWFSTWDSDNLEHKKPTKKAGYPEIEAGCQSLNGKNASQSFYRITNVYEMSNVAFLVGAGSKYTRQIGTLFSEWGSANQTNYPGSWAAATTDNNQAKRIWVYDERDNKNNQHNCDIHTYENKYHCDRPKAEIKSGVCIAVPQYPRP